MFTYRMLIEYEGTRYHGWQFQPGLITVQGAIEKGLEVLCKHPVRIIAAGRTDAGVHATGQVASFRTETLLDLTRILRSLNALTPRDISILDFKPAPDGFNARSWATGREYRYWILNREPPCSLRRRFYWHVRRPLDVSAMQQALERLVGQHDFASFKAADCASKTSVRILSRACCKTHPDGGLEFVFYANGFLKSMIRAIIGTIHQIGQGAIQPQEMTRILESCDRNHAGPSAPAQGLIFTRVDYPEDLVPLTAFSRQQD